MGRYWYFKFIRITTFKKLRLIKTNYKINNLNKYIKLKELYINSTYDSFDINQLNIFNNIKYIELNSVIYIWFDSK